jgi:predicted phage-related endonuclease
VGALVKLSAVNDEIRAANVTASEVGALLSPHPYTTPELIWDRLCSPFALEREQTDAMETGSFMETAILRLAEKRLKLKARQNARTFVHKRVRLCATPDAFVLGQPPGLIEIKLSGRSDMWPWGGPIPEHVEWQVRAQLACTARHTAAVCVLLGAGLRTYLIERDLAEEDRMLAAVERFWVDHVVTGIRPAPAAPVLTFSFETDRAIPEKEAIA